MGHAASLLLVATLIQTPATPNADKGIVTGRILSIDGTPAVAVRVMARAAVEPALAERSDNAVAIVSLTETDNAGRYRLENIPPGNYYITAGLTDLPTYYPGAVAVATATVITVAPGSITNGIDFSIQRGTGIKVTGRLAVLPTLKPSIPARASLMSPTLPLIETTINEDGTFVFPMVRPGTYTLRTSIGLFPPMTVVANDRDVNVVAGADEKGVRVIGKAVVASAVGAPVAAQIMTLSAGGQSFSAPINTDGTFEFLRVPPGDYTIRSVPSAVPLTSTNTLVVADKDITNLEVSVPFVALVSGSITIGDGAATQVWSIEARSSNGTTAISVLISPPGSNGSFTFRLSEGSHQISIRNLPMGYVVKSITSGNLDLTKSTLDIRPGKPIADIRIVVDKTSIESTVGVKVSGRIVGMTSAYLTTARVMLTGNPNGATVEAAISADGMFEFPKVPLGIYNARLTGVPAIGVTPYTLQVIVQEPVSGLQFVIRPTSQIQGVISAIDTNGAVAGIPPNISIQFLPVACCGGGVTSPQPGAPFRMQLTEGEYIVSVERLPAGYTVKSILSGSTDITRAPLKITAAQPLTEIQIVLESR